ncbi:MAG: thioredoxin [Pseudomonadota bacterium]
MSDQNSNQDKPANTGFSASFGNNYSGGQASADQFLNVPGSAGAPGTGSAEPVLDISTAQFGAEVIEASRTKPVLVDFWAPWCGPCKQLGPILEKTVAAMRGKVKLVKMNIDDHPDIAGQMGIQSIPAVVAFVDGRPKDAFMGAQSESEIRRFLEKLIGPSGPDPIEQALQQAEQLASEGAASQAASLYAAILQEDPQNVSAIAGMGMIYLETGDLERAKAVLASVPEVPDAGSATENPKLSSLRAAIELAEQAEELGDTAQLMEKVASEPDNHQARFDLALAFNASGKREEAADSLLEIMRRHRNWNEDGARTQLLQFFEAGGATDPVTIAARRKLSSMLFS